MGSMSQRIAMLAQKVGSFTHSQKSRSNPSSEPTKAAGSGVQVLVRVRPMLARELAFDNAIDVAAPNGIKVFTNEQEMGSSYHHVFPEFTAQEEVYDKVRDSVSLAVSGYNSTVFAYGQTGTGKTYTMIGDHGADVLDQDNASVSGFGVIPRAIKELFREAKHKQDREGCMVQVVCSYMEIYNDRLYDLLQPYKKGSNRDPLDMNQKRALLEVKEDAKHNTYVPNLLCVKVKSYKSVYQLISKGNANRAVRHTEMNMNSSRSHAILQIIIEQWPNGGTDGTVLRSKLNFVDLAGSERWNMGVEMQNERISEMTAINSSLSALATVVAALTDKRPHVPYRDSKLTHLLQDSLGGNCRTTIIATVSPSADAFEETCSTLRFADRARNIGNNPVVNASRDMGSILAIKEKEIQRLRGMLTQYAGSGGEMMRGGTGQAPDALQEELESMRRALDMERALRTELEIKLQKHVGGDDPEGSLTPSAGTPSTAFDSPTSTSSRHHHPPDILRVTSPTSPKYMPLRQNNYAGNVRSSAPSLLSGGIGNGSRKAWPGMRDDDVGDLASTSMSPAPRSSSVVRSIAGYTSGAPSPKRGGNGPPGAGSNLRNSTSSHGRSPARNQIARQMSFDDALKAMKEQVINLSMHERKQAKARQPPPRPNAGPSITNRAKQTVSIYSQNSPQGALRPAKTHITNKPRIQVPGMANNPYLHSPHSGGDDMEEASPTESYGSASYSPIGAYRGGQQPDSPSSMPSPGKFSSVMQQTAAPYVPNPPPAPAVPRGPPKPAAAGHAFDSSDSSDASSDSSSDDESPPPPRAPAAAIPMAPMVPSGLGPPPGATGPWGRSALLQKFTDAPMQGPAVSSSYDSSRGAPLGPPAPSPPPSGGWGRSALLASSTATPVPPSPGGGGGWGRSSLGSGSAGPTDPLPDRSSISTGGSVRSRSVGVAGRPGPGGSRSGSVTGNRQSTSSSSSAKLDAGSWIYILGSSANSSRAKQIAQAMQMDPTFTAQHGMVPF